MNKPRLVITPGEPAGIGPELVVRLLQAENLPCELVVSANKNLLKLTAEYLGLPINIIPFKNEQATKHIKSTCYLVNNDMPYESIPGMLNVANANYVISSLEKALELVLNKNCKAMVTGPVHKGILNDANIAFTGHTEWLAQKTNTKQVVMLLTSDIMRVALATTHIPIKEVANSISKESLREIITILNVELKNKYSIAKPKIFVAGLNPHAGEAGHIGIEEQTIIIPVLNEIKAQLIDVRGPFSADTMFNKQNIEQADVFLVMYHDQGLPVLKSHSFGKAANVTLGLPIIRTSVDHGVALDLAGKGVADLGSLLVAIDEAVKQV